MGKNFAYQKCDVTVWEDLLSLFKLAIGKFDRVDAAFANAGIGGTCTFLEDDLDEHGDLKENNFRTIDINLKSVLNTTKAAAHFIRKNQKRLGGSIVLVGSIASISQFGVPDYTVAKHGVLGLLRGLVPHTNNSQCPIRINALAPAWTDTNIISRADIEKLGDVVQSAESVARAAVLLMADSHRHGQMIHITEGKYSDIEGPTIEALRKMRGVKVFEEETLMKFAQQGGEVVLNKDDMERSNV